jgi:molecular chaperone DnaK
MHPLVVGIDLGTTFSAIAHVDDAGHPHVIPNADGQTTTPSVVLVQDGRIAVGDIAMNQWVTRQDHVVRWIKRAMGDPDFRFQGLSAVEISAEILKALKADAELHLGQGIDEAVITCPAYFSTVEIENTKQAGELAGLHVREIVKEPTAAAVHHGLEHMRPGERVLVCDLGGGTYDATVLAFENGSFVPLASKGDRQLGGHDWTMDLVAHAAQRLTDTFGADPRHDLIAGQSLYEACERAKRDFARVTEVAIPCALGGRTEQVVVTRDEFEAATEWRVQALVMWSEQAVEKANLTWADIDSILLVGGSSRLRRMGLALAEKSGRQPIQSREPDLAVALGAAILARGKVHVRRPFGGLVDVPRGGLTDVSFKRVIARSLGTRIVERDGDRARIATALIIPHGTESPVTGSRELAISADGQACFDTPVVEFESDSDFEVVGNYRFTCPPSVRAGDEVVVFFDYDISGIVTARARHTGLNQELAVERLPYEEPDPTQITLQIRPRWVVFALDVSGSMNRNGKIAIAKAAVIQNARSLLAAGGDACRVAVVTFSWEVSAVCQPTSDPAVVEKSLQKVKATGTTSMDDGIEQAIELVMGAPAGAARDVVMVTDGLPDDDRRARTLEIAAHAKTLGITLSNLGIDGEDVDFNFLKEMSPLSLVIGAPEHMADGIRTLLSRSAAARA